MPSTWYSRLWLVLAVVLGSLYVLVPTFTWDGGDNTTAQAGVDAATPNPNETRPPSNLISGSAATMGSAVTPVPPMNDPATEPTPAGQLTAEQKRNLPPHMAFFPKKRLNLGLDLVGGSHLALGVDTEEALRSLVGGHRRDLKDRLTKEELGVESVKQPLGSPQLMITLADAGRREALREAVKKSVGQDFEEVGFTTEGAKGVATYAYNRTAVENLEQQAVTQVLELLRTRVNNFGAREPIIYQGGANRIVVQLPDVKDPAKAIEEIKRTARLEFHIVDEEWYQRNDPAMLEALVAEVLATNPDADELAINKAIVGKIPEESALYFEQRYMNPRTKKMVRAKPILLKRDVALTGDRLEPSGVFPITDRFNNWQVAFKLDPEGADIFEKITAENVGKRLAIVLEGVVKSTPNIKEKIGGGSGVIELGIRDKQKQAYEASETSRVLRTGALPAPVRIEQNRTVGPSLGQDAIRKGLMASLFGMGMVFVFAWAWYRWSGFIATITLVTNAIVLLALMTVFDATLTLPGIAGIILTIGMAVDANVLVFERIREELRLGKNIRTSVDAGFEKAFSSIIDGNLTTAAAGIVLLLYGTDQIKGFAVTLLIGIGTTLFTALVITRLLMDYYTIKMKPEQLSI